MDQEETSSQAIFGFSGSWFILKFFVYYMFQLENICWSLMYFCLLSCYMHFVLKKIKKKSKKEILKKKKKRKKFFKKKVRFFFFQKKKKTFKIFFGLGALGLPCNLFLKTPFKDSKIFPKPPFQRLQNFFKSLLFKRIQDDPFDKISSKSWWLIALPINLCQWGI